MNKINKINLDITKYSCNELQEILNIKNIPSKDYLKNHIHSFKNNILTGESLSIDDKDKISDFLDKSLEKLLESFDSSSLNDSIIVPTSAQRLSPTTPVINKQTKLIKKIINIDTQFRMPYYNNKSSDFHITLPQVFKKTIDMTLSSINIPLSIYTINSGVGNNIFVVNTNTLTGSVQIKLDDGNYFDNSFNRSCAGVYIVDIINQKLIDAGISDLTFEIDPLTHKSQFKLAPGTINNSISSIEFNVDENGNEDNTNPIIMKLGWLLGFRYGTYEFDSTNANNTTNVVSEGICSITGPKYLYLCVNDFNNASSNNYIAAFSSSILSPNILARINYLSLVQSNGVYNFSEDDDSSDKLNRSREYFGLADIQKFHIQILDEYGRIVDFNNMDWSCELTLSCVYD